jgi:hypothetical protein
LTSAWDDSEFSLLNQQLRLYLPSSKNISHEVAAAPKS